MKFDGSKVPPMTRLLIIENVPQNISLARASIRLDEKPVGIEEIPTRNGVCRYTNLAYTLEYTPIGKRPPHAPSGHRFRATMRKPFKICCDLFAPRNVARFKGYDDLVASKHPVAIWLARNTNISRAMFEIALANPYVVLPFSLNYSAYRRKIGSPMICLREKWILEKMKEEAGR